MSTARFKTQPSLTVEQTDDRLILTLHGAWVLRHAASLQARLQRIDPTASGVRQVIFACGNLEAMDTSTAWLIHCKAQGCNDAGIETHFRGFKDSHISLIHQVFCVADGPAPAKPQRGLYALLIQLGAATVSSLQHGYAVLTFWGRLLIVIGRCVYQPRSLRLPSVVRHMHEAGVNAIPIVALMAVLISIVLAFQGATELSRFGAEIFTVDLTAIAFTRELGGMLTAVMIAGRSGSAFAAEIGVMQINEEIDALRTMGLDPFELLVLPRVIALLIMLPLLTVLADLMGLVGGAFAIISLIDLPLNLYLEQARLAISGGHFWIGLAKAPIFALIIASVATFRGLQASQSAESVGRLTTVSVVEAIFLVIAADAAISIVLAELGI